MERFDYIGDAVWLLAWRTFETENFSELTGLHRSIRSTIVLCNETMGLIAIEEKIKPVGNHHSKSEADGLEHFLGTIAQVSIIDAIEIAKQIMKSRLHIEEINKCCNYLIPRINQGHKKQHPQISKRFIRITKKFPEKNSCHPQKNCQPSPLD